MLVLAGPDDEDLAPSLRALSRQLGIDARVRFTGMLRGDDKLGALAAAGVWALPSHTENFGVAVVEAMAAGLPVVISPQVNIARDVAAADAGIACKRTPEAFAAHIGALLDDETKRRALGESARAFARRYDWSRVAPQLADMYAQVAGKPRTVREAAHAA
jgi:glycosyltransferase involved in cell wall biosynthesis